MMNKTVGQKKMKGYKFIFRAQSLFKKIAREQKNFSCHSEQ